MLALLVIYSSKVNDLLDRAAVCIHFRQWSTCRGHECLSEQPICRADGSIQGLVRKYAEMREIYGESAQSSLTCRCQVCNGQQVRGHRAHISKTRKILEII
jgi:hypothetical protein